MRSSSFSRRHLAARRRRAVLARLQTWALLAFALIAGSSRPAWAQAPAAASSAAADSLAAARADSTAKSYAARQRAIRSSWYSDRLPLEVGDVLTIVVDEQTAAQERVSTVATGNRSMRPTLQIQSGSTNQGANVSTGITSDSRDTGAASRSGALTAVLTVRVTAISPNGIAEIAGNKQVTVDGRAQDVGLTGFVRTEDISADNSVLSSRIGNAVITYKGKKMAPRTGIFGKILGILWP